MVVVTQDRHAPHSGRMAVIGLHIGSGNVEQYFPRGVAHVELELDHLCILCPLEPSFWQDRPEIHDLRLSSWLESKRNSGKLAANPAPVAMIPCGDRAYRIQLMTRDESDHSLLTVPTKAYIPKTGSSVMHLAAASDRRQHNSGRTPDRRRVARLRSDELPATAASN